MCDLALLLRCRGNIAANERPATASRAEQQSLNHARRRIASQARPTCCRGWSNGSCIDRHRRHRVLVAAWLLWRFSRRPDVPRTQVASSTQAQIELRPEFPPAGLLVPEDVLRSAGSTSAAIWDALEAAAVPVAVEYRPVTASEIARFRPVPVNAAAQQAMVDIVKALDPKSPTLYKVVLPKGAELVKAVGKSGFRGFSRTGGKTDTCRPEAGRRWRSNRGRLARARCRRNSAGRRHGVSTRTARPPAPGRGDPWPAGGTSLHREDQGSAVCGCTVVPRDQPDARRPQPAYGTSTQERGRRVPPLHAVLGSLPRCHRRTGGRRRQG